MMAVHVGNLKSGFVANIATGAGSLVLAVFLAYGFVSIFAPRPFRQQERPSDNYDSAVMLEALAPEQVYERFDTIRDFGSRFMGQDGIESTYAHIRNAYQQAGLEILEFSDVAPAPVTLERSITTEKGIPLANVEIFPFFPNTYQPMVTLTGAVTGRLVEATPYMTRDYVSLDDAIVVADLSNPELRIDWKEIAMLGAKAVVLTHAEGLESVLWTRTDVVQVAAGNNPFNFVRLAATPEILDHIGDEVLLKVRTEWRDVQHRTLLGVMRAPDGAANEALVISTSYDAFSMLPDLALNSRTAVPLAIHLQMLQALPAYAGSLSRDIYFVAFGGQMSASAGERQLLKYIGSHSERREISGVWQREAERNAKETGLVDRVRDLVQREGFLQDMAITTELVSALSAEERSFLREQLQYIINTLAIQKNTEVLRLKSIFEHQGDSDIQSQAFSRYLEANNLYNRVQARANDSLERLMHARDDRVSFADEFGIDQLLRERLETLSQYHRRRMNDLESGLKVSELFMEYQQVIAFEPRLMPSAEVEGPEQITFLNGITEPRNDAVFADVLRASRFRLPETDRAELQIRLGTTNAHDNRMRPTLGAAFAQFRGPDLWTRFGYPGFTLAHVNRKSEYDLYYAPVGAIALNDFGTMRKGLAVTGETMLSLLHGNGRFALPKKKSIKNVDFTGRVYASGVGRSIMPNYPVQGALVGRQHPADVFAGRLDVPLVFSNPYGEYELRFTPLPFGPDLGGRYSPTAVVFGENGIIQYVKDVGDAGQRIYTSENLNTSSRPQGGRNVNIVVFRATPVTILDMINPQTLRAYNNARAVRKSGLQRFDSMNSMLTPDDGVMTLFVPPAERFFVTFLAGDADNEMVQTVRAFTLGDAPAFTVNPALEIDGPGFLGKYYPVLHDVPWHTSRSMLQVNEKRLRLQRRYGMADALTLDFHERSEECLQEAVKGDDSYRDRLLKAREALTYAILNHPVIRGNVSEAVIGIIWYLGLLVPFILFFEKLVFGFSDIRKQLLAHLIIFVTVFGLLRLLHPAFQMLRSSLMILLGFLIFLITSVVTMLLSGKFKENLEAIRQKQARVKGADVNSTGVLVTAFMLGLNNMHRRKVRTGLTCATLVLLTFVMICFTSVQSNVVATSTAIGRAPYQGLLVKNDEFSPISGSELSALSAKYGYRFPLSSRAAYFGVQTRQMETFNPELQVSTIASEGDAIRGRRFMSCLLFDYSEPLADRLELLTERGWFTLEQQLATEGPVPIMIPDTAASALQITAAQVDAGGVLVNAGGAECEVIGIFKARSLAQLRGLDDRDLLPFNILAMQTIRRQGNTVLADDATPRIAPEQLIISLNSRFPDNVAVMAGDDRVVPRLISVAISMPRQPYETMHSEAMEGVPYREARETIEGYLEQSGRQAYYGLDRFAYYGRRTRASSLDGMIDMLIPLVIAALTVVNTMRGSVYERRDEIFVYNAVGIAPRYVFFMFFAEAFVYSVVGTMLGYILSQGTGRLLSVLGWTGGMNMNFTSLATVYASLTIAGAVFLSTWFPARSAMEIAAPAEDAGWKLPDPDGDLMHFPLPFTFGKRDRIAVLGFFARYFEDHGKGSSGPFFAGPPELCLSKTPDVHGNGGVVPQIDVTIWLKPFDLGVSQQLTIQLPTDPETGEFIADVTLKRVSGTLESWGRLSRRFVGRIRRHFLHWRAVTPQMKEEFYGEAVGRLRATERANG